MSIQPVALRRQEAPLELGPLEGTIGFLLRLAQLRAFDCFYQEFNDYGVRPAEATVIVLVNENPGVRQGVVARRLKIKTAQMAKMAKVLELDGILTRLVPDEDKRAMELHLTEKGRALAASIVDAFADVERMTLRYLDDDEVAVLSRLLRKLIGLTRTGANMPGVAARRD